MNIKVRVILNYEQEDTTNVMKRSARKPDSRNHKEQEMDAIALEDSEDS